MLLPHDYVLRNRLHTSSMSEVHAARRESDGRDVVLKAYSHDALHDGRSRARREFDALRSIRGAAIPRALDVLPTAPPTLVLEPIPGVLLPVWRRAAQPTPEDFLAVAIQLADSLARAHAARLLHRDIHPGNVLIDPQTLKTHLIDFGHASPLGTASAGEPIHGSDRAIAALQYIAPEQTGRMGFGVDTRSDLYALGATLYFALTGRPPFETEDHLALIHAHVARTPPSPLEHRPDLPRALARIVLKLLEKEPEDRYQTAAALCADLNECRGQLQRGGRIDDELALALADAPTRPLFSPKLYGRETEIAALQAAYARSAAGHTELVLLSGDPGSGKTALVHELRRTLAAAGGYLAGGKFDLYRGDVPYAALAAAFGSLVLQILGESDEQLARWREGLRESLGNLAAVLVELVPEFGLVVGDVPAVPALDPQATRARLALAVQRFAQGCATRQHPVVLFLDDLQRADEGSCSLLEALLAPESDTALLIVAAYRSSEVAAGHPLFELLARLEAPVQRTRIEMPLLAEDDCKRMLADALGRSPVQLRWLAKSVTRKCAGNPLLIQQFVLHLRAIGLIQFVHPSGWTWAEGDIAGAAIPEGAVALIAEKLGRLGPQPRQLIEFASCVGDEFDVVLLAGLSDQSRDALDAALFALADEGLIAPSLRGFRFVHDRIREAAQARLSAEQRRALHHRMAVLMLQRTAPAALAERAFEIADHLNRAHELLSDEERRQGLEVNLCAGRRALASGAAATASRYLDFARRLLREEHWAAHAALAGAILWEAAESAYQTRDVELALQLLAGLEARPIDPWRHAQLLAARIRASVLRSSDEALALTLDTLRRFGLRWSAQPSWLRVRLAILWTDWRLRGPLDDRVFARVAPVELHRFAPVLLIGAGASVMQQSSVGLVCLALGYILRSYCSRGALRSPGLALAAYAAFRLGFLRDLRGAARYAGAAAEWMKRRPTPIPDARGRFELWSFLYPWLETRAQAADSLWSVTEQSHEIGDIEYRDYAAHHHVSYLLLSGQPLPAVTRRLESLREHAHSGDWPFVAAYLRAYALLQQPEGPPADTRREPGPDAELLGNPAFTWLHTELHVHWVIVLCFLGEYGLASERAEAVATRAFTVASPGAYLADYAMFRGLCHAVRAEHSRGGERRRQLRALRGDLRQLRTWARLGPDCVHMARLLEAEHARLRGDHERALRVYWQGAERALERSSRHHAALLHERRAALLRSMGRPAEAVSALRDAADLYRQWGALAVLRRLEQAKLEAADDSSAAAD